jgi:hypothetical protein
MLVLGIVLEVFKFNVLIFIIIKTEAQGLVECSSGRVHA